MNTMKEGLTGICPLCRSTFSIEKEIIFCAVCGRRLITKDGVFNFINDVTKEEEKEYYDKIYSAFELETDKKLTPGGLSNLWNTPDQPENQIVLEEVGDIKGKDVLLIGNGSSIKEFAFLNMGPRKLVYSDISPFASVAAKAHFDLDGFANQIVFAAIDAENIPFTEGSFDIVYGYAMVHHLPDIDKFLKEVARVLKRGGKAIFMDDAYSPIWHHSKMTVLRPLMKHSHKKSGISPEDYRFSMSGGFRESDLSKSIKQVNGVPFFRRTSFLTYITVRGAEKLLPKKNARWVCTGAVVRWISWVDKKMSKFKVFRQNYIRIVWGLTTPLDKSEL